MRHGSTTPPVHTRARPSADGMQERTKQGSGSQSGLRIPSAQVALSPALSSRRCRVVLRRLT